jgi:hypothetical protein
MISQEHQAMSGIEGGEHAEILHDMRKTAGKGDEPNKVIGPKKVATLRYRATGPRIKQTESER